MQIKYVNIIKLWGIYLLSFVYFLQKIDKICYLLCLYISVFEPYSSNKYFQKQIRNTVCILHILILFEVKKMKKNSRIYKLIGHLYRFNLGGWYDSNTLSLLFKVSC